MAWIRVVDEADAEPELRSRYEGARDPATGVVDNIIKVHSLHPQGLDAHMAVYRAAMRGTPTLARVEREMIALVVSGLNGCHY